MELNKENKRILKRLLDVKETNMNVADILLYVYQNGIHPSIKQIQEIMESENVNETQALYIWLMNELEMNLDDEQNLKLCNKYILGNMHKDELSKYIENPYVKAISNVNIKDNNYSLKTLKYDTYQLFPLDDLDVDEKDNFVEHTPIGYFTSEYQYLALLYKNRIWMSLNPNEINTMEPHIEKAEGDILVLGLGLGYFPFMCSLKEDVKSITIIEKDKEIIHLFEKHLINQFPYKSKIKIIESDAIEYVKNHHEYDYIFADLWHDALDGINLWYELKQIERKYSLNISYWLSNSFYALERRITLTLLENLNNKDILKLEEFNYYPEITKKLFEYIKNTDDLLTNVLSTKSLKKI